MANNNNNNTIGTKPDSNNKGNLSAHENGQNNGAPKNDNRRKTATTTHLKLEEDPQFFGDLLMNSGVLNDNGGKMVSHMDLSELPGQNSNVNTNSNGTPIINNNITPNATNNNNTRSSIENNNYVDMKSEPQSNQLSSTTNNNAAPTNKAIPLPTNPSDGNNFNSNNNNITSANKQLYLMGMNNNPHVINDPTIQETLSPYFQPFGVDVAHLPMTNPPIFQSSLPLFDEPIRRRRISISNGQISQLGEDIETVES